MHPKFEIGRGLGRHRLVFTLFVISLPSILGALEEDARGRKDLYIRAGKVINGLIDCLDKEVTTPKYYDNKPTNSRSPQKDCCVKKGLLSNFGDLVQEAFDTEDTNMRLFKENQGLKKLNAKILKESSSVYEDLEAFKRQVEELGNIIKEKDLAIEKQANDSRKLMLTRVPRDVGGIHRYASKIRPPAYPLAVRSPYLNVWLTEDTLPGNWPVFWNGNIKGWMGMVRVDGEAYRFMGSGESHYGVEVKYGQQRQTYITPTQTIFNITVGQIDLRVTFLSPVEFDDVKRQSIPLSYVFVTAKSRDGRPHEVQVYMDFAGEWVGAKTDEVEKWAITSTGSVKIWKFELENQVEFGEFSDYPQWGLGVLVTGSDASHQSGGHNTIRQAFAVNGHLGNSNDDNFRCIHCDWPVLAFAHDLGRVSGESREVEFVVGHIRENNIQVMGRPQKALWTYYFEDSTDMIGFFFEDVVHSKLVAGELDDKLLTEAYAIGGQDYADIIALSLRQAMGGTEFSGNRTHPQLFIRNGPIQTVDVIYPSVPMYSHMNVKYLEYLLEPLFQHMEGGLWPHKFAIHDVGGQYPKMTGYADGQGLQMPVEETANMLLMVADIVLHRRYGSCEARDYVQRHYPILSQWAGYLHGNALFPEEQLNSDIFLGPSTRNSGLALKGILGMKAFARVSELIGEANATQFYDKAADEFISTWLDNSVHSSGTHLKMEYGDSNDNSFQLKYNALQDKLLNLKMVPQRVYDMEAKWYLEKEEAFGIRLVHNQDYTKSDWEMWVAAAFGDINPKLKSNLIKSLAKYLRNASTSSKIPLSDWYVAANGKSNDGLRGRPVVGGHFALLATGI